MGKYQVTEKEYNRVRAILKRYKGNVRQVVALEDVSKMTAEIVKRSVNYEDYKKIRAAYSRGRKYIPVTNKSKTVRVAVRKATKTEERLQRELQRETEAKLGYKTLWVQADKDASKAEMRVYRANAASFWERLQFLFGRIKW